MLAWTGMNYAIIEDKDYVASYCLPSIAIVFVTMLLFFTVPPLLILKQEDGYRYSLYIRLIGFTATICLNYFYDGKSKDGIYGLLAMINYDLVFMAQGLID